MENQQIDITIPTELELLAAEFSVDEKGVGYISGRALARLAGIHHSTLQQPAGKLIQYIEGQGVIWRVDEKEYDDRLATTILTYYALESKTKSVQAARSLAKFATVGLRVMIQKIVGWEQSKTTFQLPDFTNPVEAARAWANECEAKQLALKQAEKAKAKIVELQPKAEHYDVVMSAEGGYDMGDVAKMFKLGRNTIFEFLRQSHIMFKQGNQNHVYQTYIDKGYFIIVQTAFLKGTTYEPYGKILVTPIGVEFIRKKLMGYQSQVNFQPLRAAA